MHTVHDIITDTLIAIYASGKTIQTILLLFFLPVPAPTYDFKQALHKNLVVQVMIIKEMVYKWHRAY